ncbi:MAG: hypothetical protein QM793_07215 [Muricomes sp.]
MFKREEESMRKHGKMVVSILMCLVLLGVTDLTGFAEDTEQSIIGNDLSDLDKVDDNNVADEEIESLTENEEENISDERKNISEEDKVNEDENSIR